MEGGIDLLDGRICGLFGDWRAKAFKAVKGVIDHSKKKKVIPRLVYWKRERRDMKI